jgi:hypothetical protein
LKWEILQELQAFTLDAISAETQFCYIDECYAHDWSSFTSSITYLQYVLLLIAWECELKRTWWIKTANLFSHLHYRLMVEFVHQRQPMKKETRILR